MTTLTFRIESLKAVSTCVSTEETRYYLNGVFFKDGLMISTDGHRMAVIKDVAFSGKAAEFTLPRETVEKLCKTKPTYDKHFPVFVRLDTKVQTATVFQSTVVEAPDEKTLLVIAVYPYKPVGGTFPDWRRVIPKADTLIGSPQSFNTAYLGAFKAFGKNLTIFTNTVTGAPAVVRSKTDEFEAFGVLMPLRADCGNDKAIPDWISEAS